MCSVPFAGSDGRFEVFFPSNPEMSTYVLIPGNGEFYYKPVELKGPWPKSIAIRARTSNGLCLQGLMLDGVAVKRGFPVWLDAPCVNNAHDYQGVPCMTEAAWELPGLPPTTTAAWAAWELPGLPPTTTVPVPVTTTTATTVTTTTATTTSTTSTSTTSATSTTATTSSTSSSTTSTTATSTTPGSTTTRTSTTTTTSTTTVFVVINSSSTPAAPLTAFADAISPPAFYDELHIELELKVTWPASGPHQLSDFEGAIIEAIERFVGIEPPSFMRCSLVQPSTAQLLAELDLRIQPGSGKSAEEVQELVRDPARRARLNKLLGQIRVSPRRRLLDLGLLSELAVSGEAADLILGFAAPHNASYAFMNSCEEGALFCCVRAVVDNIVHNAGVVHAYRGYFLLAVLLCMAVCLVTLWATTPCITGDKMHSEEDRGRLVMPLFAIAVVFQALLFMLKSVEKYHMLVHNCDKDMPLGNCPPSKMAMCVEVIVFGGGLLVGLAAFWLWWRTRWRDDCRAERLQRRLRRHVVSPLESILRRSDFFSFYEVRATDKASRSEHLLSVVLNILLSLAVTLTSFFALQRYSFPSGLTAWFPYKLFYELFLACGIKIMLRKVARSKTLGSFTFAFLCASIALLTTLNVWLWITIARIFVDLEGNGGFHTWRIMRLLDIAIGAGLVNCILSPLSVSFTLYFFSVYAYEPYWRSDVVRCVHLAHPEAQAIELKACLDQDHPEESEGPWELVGVRTARGEPLRFQKPLPLPYESSESEDQEGAPCMTTGNTSIISAQSVAERTVESVLGVAKAQPSRCQPVIVDLRRARARSSASRMVWLCDVLLSVDSRLPVMRRSVGQYEELIPEDDEDDCEETSESGVSPTSSASESSSGGTSSGSGADSVSGSGEPPGHRQR